MPFPSATDFMLLVLTVCEYVDTLRGEIETIWRAKKTMTSMLLLSTRWVMVLTAIDVMIPVPSYVSSTVILLTRRLTHNQLRELGRS